MSAANTSFQREDLVFLYQNLNSQIERQESPHSRPWPHILSEFAQPKALDVRFEPRAEMMVFAVCARSVDCAAAAEIPLSPPGSTASHS